MNKIQPNYNKKILRFTEDHIPKNVEIQELPQPSNKTKIPEEISRCEEIIVTDPVVSVPKINSTLGIKKQCKQVERTKPRKVKSLSDLPKPERVTIDEKITKQMNYPFDQRLYKELISLKLIEKSVLQPVSSNYEPIMKDRAPNLEDFFEPSVKSEFNVPVSIHISSQTINRKYNGLSTYQLMQTWK